jgi:hypothetical protein
MLAEGGQPQGHLLNGALLQPLPLIAVDDRYRHNQVIHRRTKNLWITCCFRQLKLLLRVKTLSQGSV